METAPNGNCALEAVHEALKADPSVGPGLAPTIAELREDACCLLDECVLDELPSVNVDGMGDSTAARLARVQVLRKEGEYGKAA